MNLYVDRDYENPNDDEIECAKLGRRYFTMMKPNDKHRSFMKHYTSDFPNNLIYLNDWKDLDFVKEANKFQEVLNKSKKESDVQDYIKNNELWFIPASIRYMYPFGNHNYYLFPEMYISNKYKVDYMILGKSSNGMNMVLVEFENPDAYFVTQTGLITQDVNKGIKQLRDWNGYIKSNQDFFKRLSYI